MEAMGRSIDGKRAIVALSWEEVQALLNSAVQASDRWQKEGRRKADSHLTEIADFALATGNALENAWLAAFKA